MPRQTVVSGPCPACGATVHLTEEGEPFRVEAARKAKEEAPEEKPTEKEAPEGDDFP